MFTGIDGRTNLNDFAERCGFVLPPGPYETVGGFVMARLGRLPHPGDEVTVGSWRLVVTECEGRRVSRVSVRSPSPDCELVAAGTAGRRSGRESSQSGGTHTES